MHTPERLPRFRIAVVLTGVLCAAGLLAADVAAPCWPRFNGLKGDNISTETGLLKKWPDAGPKLLWTAVELGHSFGTVTVADGMIYTAGDTDKSNVITAMDMNGAAKWRFENGASHWSSKGKWLCVAWATGRTMYAEQGVGEGSLTAADGMLYILSEHRKVGLVKATPTAHEVVSQFTLPAGGKGATWAHPVVCGARLYIRHGDRLYAYDVGAK